MLKSKTVFILGAGASQEFGFPVGTGLANSIRLRMNVQDDSLGNLTGSGDVQLVNAVGAAEKSTTLAISAAADRLRRGLPLRNSIDDFLDVHREDELVIKLGKAAIVKTILEYENQCKLTPSRSSGSPAVDFSNLTDIWLAKLVKMMGPTGPEELANNSTFISFNYDRTLEFFLAQAFQNLFNYKPAEADNTVDRISIIHPYGVVGDTGAATLRQRFGLVPQDRNCLSNAPLVHTYTEEMSDSRTQAQIHQAIKDAQRLVFLGFGFHAQNIRLLTPIENIGPRQVFATAHQINPEEHEILKTRISQIFHGQSGGIELFDGRCADFFDAFHFRLSEI